MMTRVDPVALVAELEEFADGFGEAGNIGMANALTAVADGLREFQRSPQAAADALAGLRDESPWVVAAILGGQVEEGATPTTQGMVRVVGPWVSRDA